MSMDMHGAMDDCCDDELVLEVIEDSQQHVQTEKAPKTVYNLLYTAVQLIAIDLDIDQENDTELNDSGPPDIRIPDRYILFQNLKIPAPLQS